MNILKHADFSYTSKNLISGMIVSVLLSGSLKATENYNKGTENKAKEVVNYQELSKTRQDSISTYIQEQESQERYKNLQESEKLTLSYVRETMKGNESHSIANFYDIYYIPNVEFIYEYMKSYQEIKAIYKENTPPFLLVLAQMSKESSFINQVGDDGESHGMVQLQSTTARNLLQGKDKEIFSKLFFINNEGNPVFYGQKEQIQFMFHYLVLECKFAPGNETDAITKYNNGKGGYTNYTRGVLRRYGAFIFFDILQKQTHLQECDIYKLMREKLVTTIQGLSYEDEQDIETESRKLVEEYKNQKTENTMGMMKVEDIPSYKNSMTGKKSYSTFAAEMSGNLTYILKKEIFTLYSVFKEGYREAAEYHNSLIENPQEKIGFYTLQYDTAAKRYYKIDITEKMEINKRLKKGKEICVTMPDTIYVEPGRKMYNYAHIPQYASYIQPYIQRNSGIRKNFSGRKRPNPKS